MSTNPNALQESDANAKDSQIAKSKMSIRDLFVLSTSVAVVFAVANWKTVLVQRAYAVVYGRESAVPISLTDYILAAGYGIGVGLLIIALRRKGPGLFANPTKILVSVLAMMAILDLLFSILGCVCIIARGTPLNPEIFGFHYLNFAPVGGYIIGTVYIGIVLVCNRTSWNWRVAWTALLLFSTIMGVSSCALGVPAVRNSLPDLSRFVVNHIQGVTPLGTSIAMVGIVFAFAIDRIRGVRIDWALLFTVGMMLLMWLAIMVAFMSA